MGHPSSEAPTPDTRVTLDDNFVATFPQPNADDVIVYVNEHWETFASTNGAPELTAEHVVGRETRRLR